MSIDDDEDSSPDNLGSIGEQDTAPAEPALTAAPATPAEPWPPPVPSAAEIPSAPLAPPGGIVTHRVIPAPGEAENLAAIDDATAQRHDTAEQGVNLAVDKATDKAAQLQAEADMKEQQGRELRDLQATQKANVEKARQRDDEEYRKYREMGLKDPDADQSFAHRVGAALAVGLGQYSAAMNHTGNEAAHIFEQARADNMALQKAKIEQQKEASIKAGMDVKEALAQAAEETHNLNIKNVAQIDAFRAKFQAESARMGIPEARINATKTMQETDRQALEAREKHLESQRSIGRDLTPKERGKKAGAGGGGSGAATDKYVAAVNALQPGEPVTPEIIRLGLASGLKRNQISPDVDRLRGSGAKATNAGMGAVRQDDKESDRWAKDNGVPAIQKTQRELSALQKELTDNAHNPLGQALAVEKAVSAARGGAASKQALALALGHLGGTLDNAEGFIAKIKNGELGEGKMKNFTDFIAGQRSAAQGEGKNAYDAFDRQVNAAKTPEEKERLTKARTRMFSGMEGFGGKAEGEAKAAPAASPAARAKVIVSDPSKRSLYTTDQWARLIAAARGS